MSCIEEKQKKAGVLIPVFSLRSKESLGVGEFSDLLLLVDWVSRCGFHLIQLLPFQDTSITKTWEDSYPYSLLSAFALHPIYLRIEKAFSMIPSDITEEIWTHKELFNQLQEIDYENIYKIKISLCKKLFPFNAQNTFSSSGFQTFLKENSSWLQPYAAFCVLRDVFGTSDFSKWEGYAQGTDRIISQVCHPSSDFYNDVRFYYYLQFHLHQQLKEVSEYALSKDVFLKGDFPVGVHVFSVETWCHPHLFIKQRRIGAPPDYFNACGQNWEFPTYNWKEVEKRGYEWFAQRFAHLEQYCQLIRIDHILGYFRLWEIPERHLRGNLGYFSPSLSLKFENLPNKVQMHLDRYIHPYVTDEILRDLFRDRKDWMEKKFFEKKEKGGYRFQKLYRDQRALEQVKDISEQERSRLHDLHENVLLIRDEEDPEAFYPRIGMETTLSFLHLGPDEQDICRKLFQIYTSKEEEALWKKEAVKKLKAFQNATTMEICAEDLGMVPRCTKEVLGELGFLCLYIQRMPKKEGEEFAIPSEYEYLSVCSPSNHDTSPLREWWKEDPVKSQRFYRHILKEEGQAPIEADEDLCTKIIQMHLESGSRWSVFLLQDLLSMSSFLKRKEEMEERINNPAIPKYYWRWRLHIPLEDLLEEESFILRLKGLLQKAGRIGCVNNF